MKQLSDIRKLGFGLMRLPQKDDRIDIEESKIMVDKFMEAGFNYFDTAFVYNGSEEAAKEILIDRYDRESFFLATKNAAWMKCESREDCVKQFETSLERTGAGYFDMYLLQTTCCPSSVSFAATFPPGGRLCAHSFFLPASHLGHLFLGDVLV